MAKKGTHDRALGLRMDSDIVKELEKIAEELDLSVSWVVRRACAEYIQRHKASKSTVTAQVVAHAVKPTEDTSQGF
ncbi:MAG TPA: ribbon-helix-helix protein, CopG family [Candidatus Saccharimonadales bacterium]|nr:ribbon-helix-helix protein, CopG family [Candidatus Saccharimonadales bacterium]